MLVIGLTPNRAPRTEEIIAVMRCCGEGVHGARARGLIVVLWRAGLRIQDAGQLVMWPAFWGNSSVMSNHGALKATMRCAVGRSAGGSRSEPSATWT